jgi:UDP-GlcNAc3NAcA epimerase
MRAQELVVNVLTVVGARPQFVKAAAVSRAFSEFDNIHETLLHTGQHFDDEMSNVFFRQLGLKEPRYNLDIHGGGHGEMTGRMLQSLEPILVNDRPDIVLVYGDTNSTLAAALAASKLHIPIAHVEAGLRSFNRAMPEEINRILTDHLSSYLFCPTDTAVENLHREGVSDGVSQVGDVMYDATLYARSASRDLKLPLGLGDGEEFALATVHRAENTDSEKQLAAVLSWLNERARDRKVLIPAHPRLRQAMEKSNLSFGELMVCAPLGFLEMSKALQECSEVYTDSGGVQKEAYFHGKPCVTLRTETEWVETIDCGWNRLWHVADYEDRTTIDQYGNGDAARKVAQTIFDDLT